MKETPQEKKIHENMKAGNFTLSGFLGDDERHFHEIIDNDKIILSELNLTVEEIAEKLQSITDKAFESYESTIIVDDKYEVSFFTVRGKMLCPFSHSGVFSKGEVTLKEILTGKTLKWTPLNIHMIKEHSFFEGKDSKHRLDPRLIKEILF